ncbi:MAG: transporter [Sulfurimonas sp. RIFCSPHIGHO2_12_FULL_36_9]|uniref:TolC family protein n=1 Tax=Sulfurimonas sp. RIFCSPLOWO2_12_36_12 TaxID=1802253 RepID=UPI0008B4F53A|nr:TolC family protein [Sulfurimonas sp. RIFCSPLOWO2_12_36_12]OHD97734.1 MAG: transporter [Sulfurimonas sp. RIFCSPLOWO2_02_FULL_36_28]OHD99601.1 MAG: transporter [Sulfurimonas sp. RIFCSPHIGHO2_12_FULL_36_9]OHE01088.1 MAG: transporter [Sulfurimonas sp. RIFCSPLOWO2_12_36_12]OHE07868.1 MAG: transporter [Sulfurimonas sp. RIFCSPLOWO2_12_FULL_36_74]
MKFLFISIFIALFLNSTLLNASESMSLEEAIETLKSQNLEIKTAQIEIETALQDAKIASGNHYGKLDFIQDFSNSDDAGNVFGFKLSSREATFGDFGFADFLTPPPGTTDILTVQPNDLNYPDSRNYFQSKLKYEVPLFTGFKISSYEDIMESVTKIKKLEKSQVINEKIYEIRKSFYDMALLEESIRNLNVILKNIQTLETTTNEMIEVGYAKKIDLLEVKAKKGNVERLISQMESNKELLYHYISFLLNQRVTSVKTPSLEINIPSFSNSEILENNLDIQKANSGLKVKKSMIDVAQSSYYPMVGAFAEVATADDKFLGEADDHRSYTLGARLTFNIFNGGIDSANIEKSKLEYIKTKTQVTLANSGIELQTQKIRTEIDSLNNDIESLKKELLLADEIYGNYEARYKEKLSSMSDVIIKQSEQIQKILQLQQTINRRNERIFALEKLANGEQK